MVESKNHKLMVKKLKKKLQLLKKKEEKSRAKLQTALKKIQHLGKSYKSKLIQKSRELKNKLSETTDSTYAKVAANIERQLAKNIKSKTKAIMSVAEKIDKKNLAKLAKGILKKSKKKKKSKAPKKASLSTKKLSRPLRKKSKGRKKK